MVDKRFLVVLVFFLVFSWIALSLKPANSLSNNSINRQELVRDDSDYKVRILMDKSVNSGDNLSLDFFLTNKGSSTISKTDIDLDISYFGFQVLSKSAPSVKEYGVGESIHIFQDTRLPLFTPPGEYDFVFQVNPSGMKSKVVKGSIIVQTSMKSILFFSILFFGFLMVGWITRKEIAKTIISLKNYILNNGKSLTFALLRIIGIFFAIFGLFKFLFNLNRFLNRVMVFIIPLILTYIETKINLTDKINSGE